MDQLKAEACSERLVRDALEAQVNELRAKLVSYEASTAVLSLFLFLHVSARVRRGLLSMISTPSAWIAWREVMRRWLLICEGALIDIARRRKREVMRFRT